MPIYIGEGWSHAGTSPTRSCGRASGLAATQFWGRNPQKDGDRGVVRRRVLVLDVFPCWCGKGSHLDLPVLAGELRARSAASVHE